MLMDILYSWTDIVLQTSLLQNTEQASKLHYLYILLLQTFIISESIHFSKSYHEAKLLSIKFMMLAFESEDKLYA